MVQYFGNIGDITVMLILYGVNLLIYQRMVEQWLGEEGCKNIDSFLKASLWCLVEIRQFEVKCCLFTSSESIIRAIIFVIISW